MGAKSRVLLPFSGGRRDWAGMRKKSTWPDWDDVAWWFCEAGPNPVTLAAFIARYPQFKAELLDFWTAWEESEGLWDLASLMEGSRAAR